MAPRSRPGQSQSGRRRVLSYVALGLAVALCQQLGFVYSSRPAASGARGSLRSSRLARGAAGSADPLNTLTSMDFLLGAKASSEEVSDVAARVSKSSSDELWKLASWKPQTPPSWAMNENMKWTEVPIEERYLDAKQFRAVAEKLGIQANVAAVDSVFSCFTGGSGFAEKGKVDDALQNWGAGGSFNSGAFEASLLGARVQVFLAYGWLYGMSSFCGAFFFGRPILFGITGIDLFPSIRQWWM
mmetsp:Transcript_46243/g.100527  ORF Transcript_46243/g.100527 Transcript_46243/m.100527 type:complete len:243 (-) Transcript_46243:177-905(-)